MQSPLCGKGYRMPFFIRTYTRLNIFAVHPCFMCTYVFDCKFGAICLLATRPRAAVLCPLFHKHTEVSAPFFGLPPGSPPADSMCIIAVDNDWGLTPASLVPWSSPARQAGCREQYYCKKRQGHYQELGQAGGGVVLIFVSLWFCLGLVGFVVVWFCSCYFT